jgi:hypothetical protein
MVKCIPRCTVVKPKRLRYAFTLLSLSQTDRPKDVVRSLEYIVALNVIP